MAGLGCLSAVLRFACHAYDHQRQQPGRATTGGRKETLNRDKPPSQEFKAAVSRNAREEELASAGLSSSDYLPLNSALRYRNHRLSRHLRYRTRSRSRHLRWALRSRFRWALRALRGGCSFSKLRPARKSQPTFEVAILSSLADRHYRVAVRRSNVIPIVGRFHHLYVRV